jgi:hypothetical protein
LTLKRWLKRKDAEVMARAANPENVGLISKLLEKGHTKASIGRALGRDSSLIGQVYSGKKPGRNLTGGLSSLLESGKAASPPRRTTSTGKPARVRQPSVFEGKGRKKVLVMTAPTTNNKELGKALNQFKNSNRRVTAYVTFNKWKPYKDSKPHKQEVPIYAHGRSARAILDDASAEGKTIDEYLISQAKAVYKPDMAENFAGVRFVEAGFEE